MDWWESILICPKSTDPVALFYSRLDVILHYNSKYSSPLGIVYTFLHFYGEKSFQILAIFNLHNVVGSSLWYQ